MKKFNKSQFTQRGFTLAEMIVATGVLGLLGLVFFQVLNSGIILYAKNNAVNIAHEEARDGINRLTRDIHASISVPQLRTANAASFAPSSSSSIVSSTPVSGVPPTAAGVSFQNIAFGPQYVWKDPNGGVMMVKGGPGNLPPTVGLHLVAPLFGVEDDIIKVTATPTNASHHNVWLANGGETLVASKASLFGGSGATYSILYYTDRVMYLVQNGYYVADAKGDFNLSGGNYVQVTPGTGQYRYENGELHRYKQIYSNSALTWSDTGTVARYLSSPTPFYVPLNSSGAPDTRYIGINLTARDPKSSNRGYLATSSLLSTQVDYRSLIAGFQ